MKNLKTILMIVVPIVILLAVAVWPFIVKIVWYAWHEEFSKHKRLARRVWWVW